MDVKIDIIRRHENGQGTTIIGKELNLAPSTVHTVVQNAPKIKTVVASAIPASSTKVTKLRSNKMEKMERMLKIWVEDQSQRHISLSQAIIQEKAKSLWATIQSDEGTSEEFGASRGWFDRFRKNNGLHNVRIQDESASADRKAAEKFPEILKKTIKEKGFAPEQIYNIDETGLFWKKMPSRTYIAKEEKTASGFKISKDRLTLLLGGNAAGDKLKPFLVYHAATPRALKGVDIKKLPVLWRSNRKAWVTASLTHVYIFSYFLPFVEENNKKHNLDNKSFAFA